METLNKVYVVNLSCWENLRKQYVAKTLKGALQLLLDEGIVSEDKGSFMGSKYFRSFPDVFEGDWKSKFVNMSLEDANKIALPDCMLLTINEVDYIGE